MAEFDAAGLLAVEVIAAGLESVGHETVTASRPVERSRRADAAVGPAVFVYDIDDAALVTETAVLHAAAVEVFVFAGVERHCHLAVVKRNGSILGKDGLAVFQILYLDCAVGIHGNLHARGLEGHAAVGLFGHIDTAHGLCRVVYQDLGLGTRLRVAQFGATLGVLINTHNICAIKFHDSLGSIFKLDDHAVFGGIEITSLNARNLVGRAICLSHNVWHLQPPPIGHCVGHLRHNTTQSHRCQAQYRYIFLTHYDY